MIYYLQIPLSKIVFFGITGSWSNQIFNTKVMNAYWFNWCYLLLILSHTACTASVVGTLPAQLEPLKLIDISEEIQCWLIKIVDLYFTIYQTLLTFNNSTKLVEL
jgi:hypothetical protein